MALLHYICNLKDDCGNLLPIEQRSVGAVYRMLANKTISEINTEMENLADDHPAKGHYGLFKKAKDTFDDGTLTCTVGAQKDIYPAVWKAE